MARKYKTKRDRIIALRKRGKTYAQIEREAKASPTWIYLVLKQAKLVVPTKKIKKRRKRGAA